MKMLISTIVRQLKKAAKENGMFAITSKARDHSQGPNHLLVLGLSLSFLGWSATAPGQSCGELGGDYCSQSGSCPTGYNSLGQTWDCNPCCKSAPQGPSCGQLGGNYCSQSGSCPSGYDSLGNTWDCNPCCKEQAQGQMRFSASSSLSVSTNLSTVTATSTVVDSSWGCSHSSYSTTVKLYSPSGRLSTSQSSGLHASASMPLQNEYGAYSIVTRVTYYCSCIHGTAAFGAGATRYAYPPDDVVWIPPDQFALWQTGDYWKRRIRQVYGGGLPWRHSGPFTRSFEEKPRQNGCGLIGFSPYSNNTNNVGQFHEDYLANIYRCRPPENDTDCVSVFAEYLEIAGVELPPFDVGFTCLDVIPDK